MENLKLFLTFFIYYIKFIIYNNQKLTTIDPKKIAKTQGSPQNKELKVIWSLKC